jgi:hypothetical protein
MTRDTTIQIFRWSARLLTGLPLLATLFITFEDAPHHYPWSPGIPHTLWAIAISAALLLLFLAWRWVPFAFISFLLTICVFAHIIVTMELYPHMFLMVFSVPALLFCITYFLGRRTVRDSS